jgi:CubicO group peptidase (beta-lactamase class C family)
MVGGRRILPAGWIRYSTTPSPGTEYGAGFWTERLRPGANSYEWGLPGIPKDAFMARGILGQYVIVVPSKNLVIVRLGFSHETGRNINDTQRVGRLVAALGDQGDASSAR